MILASKIQARMKALPHSVLQDSWQTLREALAAPDKEKHPSKTHGRYVQGQIALSVLLEYLIEVPEMKELKCWYTRAEDEYMPSYPPMSPITRSWFCYWGYCDLELGKAKETFASIFLSVAETWRVKHEIVCAVEAIARSRIGFYENRGVQDKFVTLYDLLSKDIIQTSIPSRYLGKKNQLLLARLAPSLESTEEFSTMLCTPYILEDVTPVEVLSLFERHEVDCNSSPSEIQRFFRHGPKGIKVREPGTFWNEYVFQGYSGHAVDHIRLRGIPDRPETLPHSSNTYVDAVVH